VVLQVRSLKCVMSLFVSVSLLLSDTRRKVPVPVLDTSRGHNEIFLEILDIWGSSSSIPKMINVSVYLRLSPSVSVVSSVCLQLFYSGAFFSVCPFCPRLSLLSPNVPIVPVCPFCPRLSRLSPGDNSVPGTKFADTRKTRIPRKIGSKIKTITI
jgi:hypothetical protein